VVEWMKSSIWTRLVAPEVRALRRVV
jgi:hypothetical protein